MIALSLALLFLGSRCVATTDKTSCTRVAETVGVQEGINIENLPVVVSENSVVFFSLEEKEMEALLAKASQEQEQFIMEITIDFWIYAERMAYRLKNSGIAVKFTIAGVIYFQRANAKKEEYRLDRTKLYGMAMFGRGKPPKIVTEFGASAEPMAQILGEYFRIKLDSK